MEKILILHGWTKSLDKWNNFIESLRQEKISSELLNIPGLTSSIDKAWDIYDYVAWLKKIVGSQKDKIILLGHSNGGRIALNFAIKHPKKVEKLVLIDSSAIYHNELPLKIKKLVFRTIAKIGKKITPSKTLENLLYKLAREEDYKKSDSIMKQTMINLLNSDKNLNLSTVSVPTLIIWGQNDSITPLSDGILMNSLIKNSKLEIIKDARHSPQFTHPKEVADIILKQFNN